jgi:hypothetical protein
MKRLFATTIFAVALALLLAIAGRAAVADDVQINSVDNYAGNSNVYTDKPNTSVTITALDADGKAVESWTGTTDGKGKITIPAGYNLSKEYLKIKLASANQQALQGIVVPDNVYDRQPFSFAAPQVIEGEVVSIQTVDGVVVQRESSDKYGRMFLAAGLPAGAYLISRSSHGQPLGKIEIQQRAPDALERPGEYPPRPMQIRNAPRALKLSGPWSLSGHGFSPNCADMHVTLTASGKTEAPMVLAATEDQLKLAPVQGTTPGVAQLNVADKATGRTTEPMPLFVYDMQASLERHKLTSSQQTQLVVKAQPQDFSMLVKATVASGPVDFGGGRREAEAMTHNGQAVFPVHADRGSGPFQLTWELVPASISLSNQDHLASLGTAVAADRGSADSGRTGLDRGINDNIPGTTSRDNDRGGFADDSGGKTKDKKDDPQTTPAIPEHSKRCEWRFLRVETTNYTMDTKQVAEDKAKLAEALQNFIDKAAPAAGKVTKAALKALSISKAKNVYLVYILVEIVDGAETVIDTRVVGPLQDNEAMDFWSDSQADDGARQNTIGRNKPKGGCPANK